MIFKELKKCDLKFSIKLEVNQYIFQNVQSKLNKNSIHNVESGNYANKSSTVKLEDFRGRKGEKKIWKALCDIFHYVESTI